MIKFNVGAQRPAQDGARSPRLTAANDLVQRTLARHGLATRAGPSDTEARPAPSLNPGLDALLDGLPGGLPGGLTPGARTEPDIPPGAEFRSGEFACTAGSRRFRTYVPASAGEGVAGVLVMLHGCTQTAEDFAIGTGMNALAETHRLVVIYPHQARGANAQSCWNWFSPGDQKRGRGEPAILAGMTRQVAAEFGVDRSRTFVAGLSAGGAMAAVLGEAYGDVFSAIGVHSGLPVGAAHDVASAFAAMAGTAPDAPRLPQSGPSVRTIVFHGTSDNTVHPANGDRIVRQTMDRAPRETLDSETTGKTGGRTYHRRIVAPADGPPQLEYWRIDGLGHAWSGGQAGGSYTDGGGPDASAAMVRFFLDPGPV